MNKIEELTKQAHKLWKEGKEEQMLPYLRKAINLCKQENNFSKQIEILNGSRVVLHDNEKNSKPDKGFDHSGR